MKFKQWFITLLVFFACSTVVSANTTLDKLTQDMASPLWKLVTLSVLKSCLGRNWRV